MGFGAVVLIVAGALLIGGACQRIGHAREGFEWQIGAVGALYGELLASGLLGLTLSLGLVVDGLSLIPVLIGGIAGGGLLVVAFRAFGSRISAAAREQQAPAAVTRRRARLAYSEQLIDQPILDTMRRRFGVSVSVCRTQISGDHGWVDVELVGSAEAVEMALALARQSGINLLEPEEHESGAGRLAA